MPTLHLIRKSLGVLLCLLMLAPAALQAQTKEYQVKAAFLFNFAQFVDWPENAFTNADEPFCIGVLGDDPFGAALEQIIQGETIDGHKMTVQHSRLVVDLKNCQVVFVSKSEKGHIGEILPELGSRPVLTVGDIPGFARGGGDINFFLEGNKVRFEINPNAAQANGLKISSQLLSLGKIVSGGKEGK